MEWKKEPAIKMSSNESDKFQTRNVPPEEGEILNPFLEDNHSLSVGGYGILVLVSDSNTHGCCQRISDSLWLIGSLWLHCTVQCTITGVVHLELVSDQTTEKCPLAMKRFIARRRLCRLVHDIWKSRPSETFFSLLLSEQLGGVASGKSLRTLWKQI